MTIIVDDVTNVHKVAAALQKAANEVLNPKALKSLIQDKYDTQRYQHIYSNRQESAVGGAYIIMGGVGEQQDMTTVSVCLKQPGGYREPNGHYVPAAVVRRLRIRLDGGELYPLRPFVNGPNGQACASLSLPTRTFQRYPGVLIQVV